MFKECYITLAYESESSDQSEHESDYYPDIRDIDTEDDSSSIEDVSPSNKKKKPCQLEARTTDVPECTLIFFRDKIITTNIVKVGFLVYIPYKHLKDIVKRYNGLDVSGFTYTEHDDTERLLSRTILMHMMNFGSDIVFTNNYSNFAKISANCKVSVIRTKAYSFGDQEYIDDLKHNSNYISLVEKLSFGRITYAISGAFNMYFGENITTYLKIKDKIYPYPLNAILPSTRIEILYKFKSNIMNNKFL